MVAGAVVVAVWPDLVSLNVGVQVMNALMLPLVLGFLIALAVRALPRAAPAARVVSCGWCVGVAVLTCALGVFGGLSGAGLF